MVKIHDNHPGRAFPPAGFAAALLTLLAGAAFTAVPPIIPGLETVPEATVDSGGGTPGGNQ